MLYPTADDWREAPRRKVLIFGMSGLGKTHLSSLLRASGGLGPLQQLGVAGSQSWMFDAASDGRSTVTVEYAVSGWTPDGLEQWAGPVDFVIGEQVQRYTRLINTGSPDIE